MRDSSCLERSSPHNIAKGLVTLRCVAESEFVQDRSERLLVQGAGENV